MKHVFVSVWLISSCRCWNFPRRKFQLLVHSQKHASSRIKNFPMNLCWIIFSSVICLPWHLLHMFTFYWISCLFPSPLGCRLLWQLLLCRVAFIWLTFSFQERAELLFILFVQEKQVLEWRCGGEFGNDNVGLIFPYFSSRNYWCCFTDTILGHGLICPLT